MKFTHFNCNSVVFKYIHNGVQLSPLSNSSMFSASEKKKRLYHLSGTHIPSPPSCGPSLIYFLSLEIGLFWTFFTHGTVYCVAFQTDFLHLAIMFPRFMPIAACVSASFYGWVIFHCADILLGANGQSHLIRSSAERYLVASPFGLLWIMQLCTLVSKFLCGVSSLLLDMYPVVESLGHRVTVSVLEVLPNWFPDRNAISHSYQQSRRAPISWHLRQLFFSVLFWFLIIVAIVVGGE